MEESQSLGRIAQTRQEQSTTAPSPVIIPDDTPKQKRTKISDICKTFLSSSDNGNTSKTNINIDTNVEEQDNNENSEGQESDNDVIIKQENSTKKRRATRNSTGERQKVNK